MIHELTRRGVCARVYVDTRLEGVELPVDVCESWGHELVLDLDPSWPLDLLFDDEALHADLSFQSRLVRCRIPFRSIWGVIDRSTMLCAFFQENMPSELSAEPGDEDDGEEEAGAPGRRAGVPETSTASRPARRSPSHLRVIQGGKKS